MSAPGARRVLLLLCVVMIVMSSSSQGQIPAPFQKVIIDNSHLKAPWGKSCGDINGDGKMDLLAGGATSGGLLWYENPTWAIHSISSLKGFSTDIEIGDVDRDGINDVVALGADKDGNPGIFWFKNPGQTGSWVSTTIDLRTLHDLELADLDGDGDTDIVARDQEIFGSNHGDIIYVYLQVTPTSWTKSSFTCTNGEGLKLADINTDGKKDIVINGTWFENNGSGTAWTAHPYTSTYTQRSVIVAVGDVNNDGRSDIALSPSEPVGGSYRVSWFESPVDPTQTGWTEHIVANGVETDRHGLGIADINLDGLPDIVTAAMSSGSSPQEVAVYYNADSGVTWVKNVLSTTGSHNIRLLDVDNDDDVDIFGANWQGSEIDLWVNQTNPNTPLPIQLASFWSSVEADGGGVLLSWRTISEQKDYGFEVQRRVGTTGNFATLPGSFVAGHGTTVEPHDYHFLDASAPVGFIEYRLELIDLNGSFRYSDPLQVNLVTNVRIDGTPPAFSLSQNYPNPFNPTTVIDYQVPALSRAEGSAATRVNLVVVDLLGREVAALVNGVKQPGNYSVTWNADGMASGIYFYTLRAGDFISTKRLVLMK
jgi:hypothetical protein